MYVISTALTALEDVQSSSPEDVCCRAVKGNSFLSLDCLCFALEHHFFFCLAELQSRMLAKDRNIRTRRTHTPKG